MTIEDQITALLAEAEPLRLLPDEEAEAKGLPGIVDKINALRAEQAGSGNVRPVEIAPHIDDSQKAVELRAEIAKQPDPLPVRRPGRPRKTPVEGANA